VWVLVAGTVAARAALGLTPGRAALATISGFVLALLLLIPFLLPLGLSTLLGRPLHGG
jgi:hypothetical protein